MPSLKPSPKCSTIILSIKTAFGISLFSTFLLDEFMPFCSYNTDGLENGKIRMKFFKPRGIHGEVYAMDSPAYDDIALLPLMAQAKLEALSNHYLYHPYHSLFVSLNHNQALIIVSTLLFNNTFL
jgi:hypothetical protein